MMYSKIILMAIMVLSAIAMISADVEVDQRALRRRNKSNKSKSGKKDKSDKSDKSSKKSRKSKSSKKKGVKSKSDKSSKKCDKSGKSGKSAKKDCRNPGEERVDIDFSTTVTLTGGVTRAVDQSNVTAFDVALSVFDALTESSGPDAGELPWEVECVESEDEPDVFFCVAVKPDVEVDDAAVIVGSLEIAFADGSFDAIISTDLGGAETSDNNLAVATDAPTTSPTDGPTVSPTPEPTEAPVAPTPGTLAPSASAYPTAADPVPAPTGDDD